MNEEGGKSELEGGVEVVAAGFGVSTRLSRSYRACGKPVVSTYEKERHDSIRITHLYTFDISTNLIAIAIRAPVQ
jgi:hypothetical protein